jgi:hypothetical protein
MTHLYNFAPKALIDSLSEGAKSILESRINTNQNTLRPYMNVEMNIRIRGLKPSVLYVTYSILNENNIIESMYVKDAEEAQCQWIQEVITRIQNTDRLALFLRAMTEMTWCDWEDKFLYTYPSIPMEHLHCGYKDITNNTFMHCIAYASASRTPVDISILELLFQSANFTDNDDMFTTNDLGETPLKILRQNDQLCEFVESLLLRLPQEKRLKALPFDQWDRTWDSLLRTTINEPQILIEQTKTLKGFLTLFMHYTFTSQEAMDRLFQQSSGYKLKPEHLYFDKFTLSQRKAISSAIINNPSWHNSSVWLHLITTESKNCTFGKLKSHLSNRISVIKEQLIMKVMRPRSNLMNET